MRNVFLASTLVVGLLGCEHGLQRRCTDSCCPPQVEVESSRRQHLANRREDGQTIQGPLGAYLLDEANHQVKRDHTDRDKRIEVLSHEHQGEPNGKENNIDSGKNIFLDNLPI